MNRCMEAIAKVNISNVLLKTDITTSYYVNNFDSNSFLQQYLNVKLFSKLVCSFDILTASNAAELVFCTTLQTSEIIDVIFL